MKRKYFYLLALWFPLIVPLLVYVAGGTLSNFSHHGEMTLSQLILLSGAFGGGQYFLFIVALIPWLARKDARFISRFTWWLPVIFTPVCGALGWLFFAVVDGTEVANSMGGIGEMAWFFGAFCLGVGYGYVLLTHLLAFVLCRLNIIRD